MAKKRIRHEQWVRVKQALSEAPVLPASYLEHEDALEALTEQIRDAYSKKNYDVKQIVDLLKNHGSKVSQREVRGVLQIRRKRQPNLCARTLPGEGKTTP